MTDDQSTHAGDARPSDEELFEYAEGTLPTARRAEVARAIELDPELRALIGSAKFGAEASQSYASARMPMDSAVSLHRALGAEWLEREERERSGGSAKETKAAKPRASGRPLPSISKPKPAQGRSWWRSPSIRVALSFAVVALVAGVGISGLRSVSGGSDSASPTLQDSSPAPAGRSAESPAVGAGAVAGSANEKSTVPPAQSDMATSEAAADPEGFAPAPTTGKSEASPDDVVCVFVDSSVPIPVTGPANPVLGDVKRSLSLDFTIAPYRIDCKF